MGKFTESWYSDELLPLLKGYEDKGARKLVDFLKYAKKDNEDKITQYLLDIDSREWKDVKKALSKMESVEEAQKVKVTKGMANSLDKSDVKYVCSDCGMSIPKYAGRDLKSCPACGGDLERNSTIYKSDFPDSVEVSKGMAKKLGKSKAKYKCNNCGMTVPSYPGKYPNACPNCGGNLVVLDGEGDSGLPLFGMTDSLKDMVDRAKTLITERSPDVEVLGILGNVLYLAIDSEKRGFTAKKGEDIEKVEKGFKKRVRRSTEDALDWLYKRTSVKESCIDFAKERKVEGVEEVITKNRVVEKKDIDINLGNYDEIQAFLTSEEGETMLDSIKQEKEDEEGKGSKKQGPEPELYNKALLSINGDGLLEYVLDIREDTDSGAVAALIDGGIEDDDLDIMIKSLKRVGKDAEVLSSEKDDEGEDEDTHENKIVVVW